MKVSEVTEPNRAQPHAKVSPLEPLMKIGDVEAYLGIKKSSIYRAIKEGTFPPPIQLTPNTSRWRRSEVEAFVTAKAEGR